MSYLITTDSTCDLPQEFYTNNNIPFIGMNFQINGHPYQEGPQLALSSKEFYDQLRVGEGSTTMQVNTYEFIDFVEPFLAAGQDVLHVSFSSGLSGTYASYVRGAEELAEKYPARTLLVVDSLSASMGEGLLVYYAQQNLAQGMSLRENAAWLEEHKLHLCHWFTVDDLMHLHRGGRVSKTSAVVGSLLGIKPVLHVDDKGQLTLVSKSRGRLAAMETLVNKMKETGNADLAKQTIFVSHGDCAEEAGKLADMVKRATGVKQVLIHPIGAVIGSHSGPGTLALFFLGSHR